MGSNAELPIINNMPAAPQINVNVPAVPQINVQGPAVVAQPVGSIAIANSMFSALSNTKLSLAKDNWPKCKIDPASAPVSFLLIEDSKLLYLIGVEDASIAWNNLLARHEKQGREQCSRIYSQLVPNEDVMMLNALEQFLSNPTATSAVLANRINQEVVYKAKSESSPETALTAQHKRSKSTKICSNCKRSGHLADTCFQKGGAMEGKKDEVLAAKAKSRAEKGKSSTVASTNAVKRDQAGRAYILDAETDEVILLAESPAPASVASTGSALSADTNDPFSGYPTWINLNAFNSSSSTKISPDSGPFILDASASIHISPDRADFEFSHRNTHILDPVLCVPQAAVRLISVRASSQNLTTHFNETG
jgi:hypothetical protein